VFDLRQRLLIMCKCVPCEGHSERYSYKFHENSRLKILRHLVDPACCQSIELKYINEHYVLEAISNLQHLPVNSYMHNTHRSAVTTNS